MEKHSRRTFMKTAALFAVAAPLAGVLARSSEAEAKGKKIALPAGQKAVPESDPVAKAIGYQSDVKNIDYVKYPKRKEAAAKDQFCKSCALYTPSNEGWGKCQMLAAGLVAADGWCGTWSQKKM
jgi:hypothetical protein